MITQPYQLYVERKDRASNMARFYSMSIDANLFGELSLTRRWGRIGAKGQTMIHHFEREQDAVALFLDLTRHKRARGYRTMSLKAPESDCLFNHYRDGDYPLKQILRGLTSVAFALCAVSFFGRVDAAQSSVTAQFAKCSYGVRKNCVVDGDTLWISGQKVRVADIDAPEISTPKCNSELVLGNRATSRLIELLNEGPLELQAWPGRDADRYGRKLRVLIREGRSLGDRLVAEGLARTWSGRREPWC